MKQLEEGTWVQVGAGRNGIYGKVNAFVISSDNNGSHIEILGEKYEPNKPYKTVRDVVYNNELEVLPIEISKQDRVMLQHIAVETNDAEWFEELNNLEVYI
jgi:Uri superfamily endonuclease